MDGERQLMSSRVFLGHRIGILWNNRPGIPTHSNIGSYTSASGEAMECITSLLVRLFARVRWKGTDFVYIRFVCRHCHWHWEGAVLVWETEQSPIRGFSAICKQGQPVTRRVVLGVVFQFPIPICGLRAV